MTTSPANGDAASCGRTAEVHAILSEDETLLGRVFRHDLNGLSPTDIAEAEGNAGVGFVYTYRTQLKALLHGEIPTSPTISQQAARRVRKWLKTLDLSPQLKADLEDLESTLMSRAEDATAQRRRSWRQRRPQRPMPRPRALPGFTSTRCRTI